MLGDIVNITAVLPPERIFQIRGLHMDRIPVRGEAGTDDTRAVQCLGNNTEESLNQRPAADADTVAEVTIALPSGRIVVADLSEVGRTLAVVHLIHDVRFHQPITLLRTTCLEIGQRGVHHLSRRHIVDAPRIRHPVGSGDSIETCLLDGDVRDVTVDVLRGLISLFGRTGATVDGCIDAPYGRMVMGTFQSHSILILSPYTFAGEPQTTVHRLENSLSLVTIGLRGFADDLRDTGCQFVATIVIGRAMSDRPAAIIEGIAGPATAIGVIEMVSVGVEVTFLPYQMRLEYRPHLPHIDRVGIILEVP